MENIFFFRGARKVKRGDGRGSGTRAAWGVLCGWTGLGKVGEWLMNDGPLRPESVVEQGCCRRNHRCTRIPRRVCLFTCSYLFCPQRHDSINNYRRDQTAAVDHSGPNSRGGRARTASHASKPTVVHSSKSRGPAPHSLDWPLDSSRLLSHFSLRCQHLQKLTCRSADVQEASMHPCRRPGNLSASLLSVVGSPFQHHQQTPFCLDACAAYLEAMLHFCLLCLADRHLFSTWLYMWLSAALHKIFVDCSMALHPTASCRASPVGLLAWPARLEG
ncbi:hypothetical protein IWZ00DRAFT_375476 [Phyllosticta capitalensis]